MAKWGEGDPRWIVEERPDATNVNNWHWTDKDASVWSKDKLKSLLVGVTVEGREGKGTSTQLAHTFKGRCEVIEVSSCSGEASANNRKGRLIFFYDWQLKLKWKGMPGGVANDPPLCSSSSSEDEVDKKDGDDDKKKKKKKKKNIDYSGEIEIPNLSEENDMDEVDVIVTLKKRTGEGQSLKELMHRESPAVIRKCLREYLRCLKEEYSKDLILPKKDSSPSLVPSKQSSQPPIAPQTNHVNSIPGTSSPKSLGSRPSASPVGCRIYTAKINMTESFLASVEDIYDALTELRLVEAFTQSKATVNAHRGGSFSMMDGMISGEFVECTRPTKIVQKWRLKSWPAGHHSTVTLTFHQCATCAELTLVQTEVPEAESSRTKEGWKRYIFQRIKATFGYGAQLF